MNERPHDTPCPPARPVPGGPLPTPDGSARYPVTARMPSRAPLRVRAAVIGCVVVALVVMAAGIAGLL